VKVGCTCICLSSRRHACTAAATHIYRCLLFLIGTCTVTNSARTEAWRREDVHPSRAIAGALKHQQTHSYCRSPYLHTDKYHTCKHYFTIIFFELLLVGILVCHKSISSLGFHYLTQLQHDNPITCAYPSNIASHHDVISQEIQSQPNNNTDTRDLHITMPPSNRPPQSASRPTANTTTPTTRPRSPETHESLQRRNAAAEILQSYEMLSWFALDRNEVRTYSTPRHRIAHSQHCTVPSSSHESTVSCANPPAFPLTARRLYQRRRKGERRLED
jgi:hypothetical protein